MDGVDGLTRVLEQCRLSSTIFSRAVLEHPWSVHTSGTRDAGIFHGVVEGECTVAVAEADPVRLARGDVVFLPRGDAHVMSSDPSLAPDSLSDHVRRAGEGEIVDRLEIRGGGARTRLVCGSVRFAHGGVHPLLDVLPRVVRVERDPLVAGAVALLHREVSSPSEGAGAMITRVADALLVQGIRRAIADGDGLERGWLLGLRDPQIGRAIACVHREPERGWTVALLARRAGMSRSAFAARFHELVGEPPTRYLTRWRIHLATGALADADASLAEVAESVGYTSETAFSKAFKRLLGVSPGAYRRQRGDGATPAQPPSAGAAP